MSIFLYLYILLNYLLVYLKAQNDLRLTPCSTLAKCLGARLSLFENCSIVGNRDP